MSRFFNWNNWNWNAREGVAALLVADGLYGIHVGGLLGGDVAEEDADEDADEEGDVDAPHGDAGGHAEQGYEELAGADAHEDAQ